MLDNELHITKDSRAVLISVICPKFAEHSTEDDTHRSLLELKDLLKTLDVKTGSSFVQTRKSVDPATIVGKGKLEEVAECAEREGADLLVCDFELTAGQIRNIKKITGFNVVDRCHVILEIFSCHARSREAKIQIEISRLQYLLPRLAGFWSHLGRQRGGVAVKGGEGEKQIELDRRIVRSRIEHYKKELKAIAKTRKEQRKKRAKKTVTAALVGYTNAGKSSLMNRLCQVNVLEEDKLFATLDSTYRTLNPDTKPPMILIDTVGFLSNLPNTLIDGFKTTLESALEADLIIKVVDISDPYYEKHLEVTKEVLAELGVADKPQIIVFNKRDKMASIFHQKIIRRSHPKSFLISSFNPEEVRELRDYIINFFLEQQESFDLFIPYDAGDAHSVVASKTNVMVSSNHEKGIFYRVRVPDFIFQNTGLKQFLLDKDHTYAS